MNCINELVKAIREIPELAEIDTIGTPIVCSLALVYKKEAKKNIYHLEGALATRGWKFSGIQLPPAIHISLNHGIANRTKELIKDLKASVKEVAEYPDRFVNSSSASMYGASIKVPDIKTLDRVLDCVIDSFLKLWAEKERYVRNQTSPPLFVCLPIPLFSLASSFCCLLHTLGIPCSKSDKSMMIYEERKHSERDYRVI